MILSYLSIIHLTLEDRQNKKEKYIVVLHSFTRTSRLGQKTRPLDKSSLKFKGQVEIRWVK
jgi:hypothetical protein